MVIRVADESGPFRTVSAWVFTKYLGNAGVGVVTAGGEENAGAEGSASFWTAATLGADGAVSDAGIGVVAGVCSETANRCK